MTYELFKDQFDRWHVVHPPVYEVSLFTGPKPQCEDFAWVMSRARASRLKSIEIEEQMAEFEAGANHESLR